MMVEEMGGQFGAKNMPRCCQYFEAPWRPSRFGLTALFLLISCPVSQATPVEDSYIAARDRYIAKFKKYDEDAKFSQLNERFAKGDPAAKAEADRISQEHERALADLKGLLRRIVAPPPIEGLSKAVTNNLFELSRDSLGFGMVDGLVFRNDKTNTKIFATTERLLVSWLNENKDTPQDLPSALNSESLQTSLFFADASTSEFVDIPVVMPKRAKVAMALAIRRTQDPIGERAPEAIVVSVVQPPRVFVLSAPVKVNAEIPICNKIWRELEHHRAGADSIDKTEDEALKAFHRCYTGRTKSQSFFPALIKQAQALANFISAPGASGAE
jgi:hypothetical protein